MKTVVLVVMMVMLVMLAIPAGAAVFFDDFNDGILDGYTFVNDFYWIEGGILRQNTLGYGVIAFVNGHEYADQIIEDDTKAEGLFCFSGFMFWYQDPGNLISVVIDPTYDRIRVIEKVDWNTVDYYYPVSLNDGQWYNLRVEADSTTSEIDMYVDGIYQGTHYSVVNKKVGQTGLFTACDNLVSPPPGLYIDNFSITTPTYSNDISGKVTLSNFVASVTSVLIATELRMQGGDTTALTLNLASDGSFIIEDVPQGDYDISFKASHWLRKTITDVAVFADVTMPAVSLINGDINGDNVVNGADLALLKKANGSIPGSRKWNPNADLNGDNRVNKLDSQILQRNLGTVGDQ